jgi:integrase
LEQGSPPKGRDPHSAHDEDGAASVPDASAGAGTAGVTGHGAPTAITATPAPRLLDQLRTAIRLRHYSPSTEYAYAQWVRRFIVFHDKRHPRELGAPDIERFLTHLAVDRHVSASTQNQALNAIVFLYREVLGTDAPVLSAIVRARKPRRLPVVLTQDEVRALLDQLHGAPWLVAAILYGAGLRLLECLTLRVKDLDFETREIRVRDGKGRRDRVAPLPKKLIAPLRTQWGACRRSTAKICVAGSVPSHYRARSRRSIRARRARGVGSGCSRRAVATGIRRRVPSGAITSTRRRCSAR